ncbi:TPA: hypothetical protein NG570_004555 [Vibrio parahaemolyticus]|nr:hypothetical protein [Vibrio parahaemolyticus]EJA3100741.1 hypothetical protein [Vibrio parahaemolyticus]MBE3727468.1 hypothetical protein [Vibrio parahaemolyticus]MBE5132544.1 hypothetical protein [Vibrio parahaemolyticus]HAV1374327.1 hypothetical protein [Vibrio parahaemolyticus]
MKYKFLLLMSLTLTAHPAASEDLSVEEWLDIFIASCVGSGSSYFASGSVDVGAGFSLKKLKADGSIEGKVELTKSSYRLLSEGISNAMSETAAGQADKVRECLTPVRKNLLIIMNQQIMPSSILADNNVFILSPYEELIMKTLAQSRGVSGETGKNVKVSSILEKTNLTDIRFRASMRQLQSKGLAAVLPSLDITGKAPSMEVQAFDAAFLSDSGEAYVLSMGYAN